MDEQRLPFPVHGTGRTGDGDPGQGLGDAARLLFFVNLIADTAGVPVYRLQRQTPYGMVTASAHGPVVRKAVHTDEPDEVAQEDEQQGLVRLAWLPEGFVITPRTTEAPDGYGMPPTPNRRGTPGGPLREVIINRFQHNQYPDALYDAMGGERSEDTRVCAANLCLMDWEMVPGEFSVGMVIGGKWQSQFKNRFETNFSEAETDTWYCHRPMLEPRAEDVRYVTMRDEANLMRAAAGYPPLGRPIRGMAGILSESPVYMAKFSGTLAHNCYGFREGHQRLFDRGVLRGAFTDGAGENLFLSGGVADSAFVLQAMESWRASPGHYSNIIDNWESDGASYAAVDSAARYLDGAAITGRIPAPHDITTPIEPLVPPTVGSVASQIFLGQDEFVHYGFHGARATDAFGLDPLLTSGYFNSPFQGVLQVPPGQSRPNPSYRPTQLITFRGVHILVWDEDDGPIAGVLAAAKVTIGARDVLRVISLDRNAAPVIAREPAYIVVRDGLLHDFCKTREETARFQIPADAGYISPVRMSDSGNKAVFCYSVPVPCLNRLRPNSGQRIFLANNTAVTDVFDESDTDVNKKYMWGCKLVFVEWVAGAGFRQILEQSLGVDTAYDFPHKTRPNVTSTCQGSYKFLAAYTGESLVYATVHVDSSLYLSVEEDEFAPRPGRMLRKRSFGKLVFPDGSELVYNDLDICVHDDAGGTDGAFGTHLQILNLDILNPQDAVYLRHEISGSLNPVSACSIVSRGKVVKLHEDVIAATPHDAYYQHFADVEEYTGVRVQEIYLGLSPYKRLSDSVKAFLTFVPPVTYSSIRLPSAGHQAMLFGVGCLGGAADGIGSSGGGMDRGYDSPCLHFSQVGPEIVGGNFRSWAEAVSAHYRGEAIVAGKVTSPFDLPGRGWEGEDAYFHESSLDLKAITGLPDLKQNILPIGVL